MKIKMMILGRKEEIQQRVVSYHEKQLKEGLMVLSAA